VTVEDLDSRNGTYVRVRGRRRLSVGDALRVGSAGLQIRAPG
jgi:pSer/pThr/pTyr-binding forkhead associated (FHA) protein